jgi:hypothetical protein
MYKQAEQSSVSSNHVPTTTKQTNRNPGHNDLPLTKNSNGGQTDTIKSVDMDVAMTTDLPTPAWGWLDSLDWDDIRMNAAEVDWSQRITDMDIAEDPHSHLGALFTDNHQNMLDVFASERGNGGLKSINGDLTSSIYDNHHESRDNASSIGGSSYACGIAELSHLSTILSPLHTSSLALAERQLAAGRFDNQEASITSPFIDGSSFKLVAEWLVHVSAGVNASSLLGVDRQDSLGADCQDSFGTPPASETIEIGAMLHKAFSATRKLLETLRCLSLNAGPASAGGMQPDLAVNGLVQQSHSAPATQDSGPTSYLDPRAPSQYFNCVIRHLVIACHTMLLGTYVRLLTALEHDADRFSTMLARPPAPLPRDGSPDIDAASAALADIRLVMVVQLCSYLTERQCQAVDSYLSFQPALGEFASPNQEADVIRTLRMEVQHCLRCLQQALGI